MAGKRTTLPLADLVEDMTIYPRHAVDDVHIAQLVQALRAGALLPPIVVDRTSKRIVDGWHRVRAHRRVLGPTGTIDADLRHYDTEADLLLDAIALNATHGRKLDRIDQARSVLLAERAGIALEKIAVILSVPLERVQKLRIIIAKAPADSAGTVTGTTKVVLKRAMYHLAGEMLTAEQVAAHDIQAGTSFLLQARQMAAALRHNLVNRNDEHLRAELALLHTELGNWLALGATI